MDRPQTMIPLYFPGIHLQEPIPMGCRWLKMPTLVIDTTTSGTSYTPTTSLADGEYYWRVNASNSHGTSNWSAVWSFTVVPVPLPVINWVKVWSYDPNNWGRIEGGGNIDAGNVVRMYTNVTSDSTFTVTIEWGPHGGTLFSSLADYDPDRDYYYVDWNIPLDAVGGFYDVVITAENSGGPITITRFNDFEVTETIPAPPTLISPSDGSVIDDDTPVFSWNASSGANSYGLQAAQDAGFTTLVIDTTTSSTSYTPTTSLADGEYYWRVNASNSHGTSNWSVVWNFTIDVPINEPPTVTVLSPNGNEIFPSGSQVEITWEATDAEDGENLSVNLYYSTDGGSSFPLIISTLEENDGHHTWNIPEISCSTCRILVQVTDSGGLSNDDMSDADFSILEPPDSIDLVQSWGMAAVVGDQYGLAWDESDLWSIVIGKTIYKHDPTDITSILDYSAVPGNGEGLAWDGVNMWVTGTNTLFKLNGTDGSDYEEIIPSEYTTRFAGLTWRDGYIWVLNHNMTIAEIRKIDPNTGIVLEKYTIDIGSSITNASSLEWDPYRGVFWLGLHESNQIYMLNGNNPGEVLQIYTVEGITGADGLALAYDGEILWVSSVDGAYLYKLTFTPNIRFNNAVYPSQKDFFNLRIGNDNIIVDEKMRSTFKFSNLKDFFSFFYINYGIV